MIKSQQPITNNENPTAILVTGANGQLGKTIEELFSNNEDGIDFTFVTKEDVDITNVIELSDYFDKNKFDYCINCAAYTNVEQAEKTPEIAYKVNAEGVKYLAEICKKTNTILIHISTDYVFDGEKKEPYTINDLPNPINEYGKSKLLGEQFIKKTSNKYFIIRTSWLYSKKYGNNFYRTILEKAKKEDELYITDEQTGCPTDAVNLSKYIIDLTKEKHSNFGTHPFCDEKPMTWFDFAEQILQENNLKNKAKLVKVSNYITFASRPRQTILAK
jgi:dTDP-4-dehydrorhamnose reductase